MADFKKRRHAREWAVQILFQIDLNHPSELEPIFAEFWGQQVACKQEDQADADRRAYQYEHPGLYTNRLGYAGRNRYELFAREGDRFLDYP